MKFSYIVFSWILFQATESHDKRNSCSGQWKRIRDNCYLFHPGRTTWDEALAFCIENGGYLVNLETLEEAVMLKKYMKKYYPGTSFFNGGRKTNRYLNVPGGDWKWIKNGEMREMKYMMFAKGQPKHMPSSGNIGSYECLVMYPPTDYGWHDTPCDNRGPYGYICEK